MGRSRADRITSMPTETPAAPSAAPADSGSTGETSFISSALSALSEATSGGSQSDPAPPTPPAADEPPIAPGEPPKAPDSSPDEDDAKAEADIKRETANMPAPQRAAFTKLRYEARDLKRQLKSAMEEKSKAQTPAESTEANVELERLRAEYDTMKEKVSQHESEAFVTRLESSEIYQKEVAAPRDSVATAISDIAKRYSDVDQDAVVAAVRSGDPDRISRVTADMSDFDRYNFYNHVTRYHDINRHEENLRANSKDTLENHYRFQREQEQARASEEKSTWEKSIGEVWKQLEDDFPVLAPVDGDTDWNQKLETVKAFATPDRFQKLTVRERAEALHRAAAFPVLVTELEAALDELKSAQDKLSKYESATPGMEPDGGRDNSSPGIGDDFMGSALSMLRKAGAR
jgi:hypothetical protein